MVIERDLMEFYDDMNGILMVFNGDSMVLHGDLMVVRWDVDS
jgi:hypothetical protein